jgi:hypothetical protein
MTAEEVTEMLNSKGLVLNKNGLFNRAKYRYTGRPEDRDKFFETAAPIDVETEAFKTMMKLIVLMVKPSFRKCEVSSYNGKHVIEDFLKENYISNGEFIMAMMMHGFRWKHDSSVANVAFYAQWRVTGHIVREDWIHNNIQMPRF